MKGHALGRKALRELGCIVTPDTILRWYRELIAEKYDGSEQRKMGRPRTPDELQDLVMCGNSIALFSLQIPRWERFRVPDEGSPKPDHVAPGSNRGRGDPGHGVVYENSIAQTSHDSCWLHPRP